LLARERLECGQPAAITKEEGLMKPNNQLETKISTKNSTMMKELKLLKVNNDQVNNVVVLVQQSRVM
jgi:hypothetical protein